MSHWPSLRWIPDSFAVLRAPDSEIDWKRLVRQAKRLRATLRVHDALSFLRQELDAPVPPLPSLEAFPGPKGRYSTILRIIATEHPTVRQLLGRLAAGGGHWTLVGTPEQIADQMEHWFVHEGADGFNLMPSLLPGGLADIVEYVVPELQRRGLFRTQYEGTTLRANLGLSVPQLSRSDVSAEGDRA